MKSVIVNDMISLKELAQISEPMDWQKEYASIRQRAARGKFRSYEKIKGEGYVNITDPAISISIQIQLKKYQSQGIEDLVTIESKSNESLDELSTKQQEVALARVDLINNYLAFVSQSGNSTLEAKIKFVEAFNNKAFENLFNIIGEVSFKTIERWKKTYFENNKDYRSLAPQYKLKRSSSVTPQEASILTQLFLNPNQPLMSEVVRQAIDVFIARRFTSIKSAHTYRRFLEQWKDEHYADYVFFREGEKALDDKVIPYIERDYDKINVGDIIVADGHVLNFEIINPYTGKPKRMTMVAFLDMKSSMPLGWDISPSENTQTIAVALRRSIMVLGMMPKIVYMDNGRAFGAKFFNGVDFNTSGLTGLFSRLGIKVITAIPYHGQSKTIERFFRTFSEIERLIPSYSGTSIEMKPPRMNRGEKLHMGLHEKMMSGTSIDIYSAHRAIAWWFDQYSNRPQQNGHLKGITPREVFSIGKGAGVEKDKLIHLMMAEEIKSIGRNGIRMFGTSYWHEALFGKAWDEVLVRFDLLETESIFVYEKDGTFICEAKRVDKIHPAAGILGTEEDVKQLNEQLSQKQMLKKTIVGDAKKFLQEEILPSAKKQYTDIIIHQINQQEEVSQEKAITKKGKKSLSDRWAMPDDENRKKASEA